MASYKLTSEARYRLHLIWDYSFEQWGEEQADAYLIDLKSVFEKLAADAVPTTFPATRIFPDAPPDILYHRHGKHYIFFLRSEPGCIEVLSIIHTASQQLLETFLEERVRRQEGNIESE